MIPKKLLKFTSGRLLRSYWDPSRLRASPSAHSLGGMSNGRDTCRSHFDTQVSKADDRHLGRCTVINDVPFSLEIVLFILF